MIITNYDLAFCKHALYCIYDRLIDEQDKEYFNALFDIFYWAIGFRC